MSERPRLALLSAIAFIATLLPAQPAFAAGWTNGRYLYRYLFWGSRQLVTHVRDYELFPYHTRLIPTISARGKPIRSGGT